MGASLYERIGGQDAIMSAVERFYDKVLGDAILQPFFAALDMSTQGRKLVGYLAWAFGGPDAYRGRDLHTAHAPLLKRGLSDAHFDALAGHLETTLQELGVEHPLVEEAMHTIAQTRAQVLARDPTLGAAAL